MARHIPAAVFVVYLAVSSTQPRTARVGEQSRREKYARAESESEGVLFPTSRQVMVLNTPFEPACAYIVVDRVIYPLPISGPRVSA